MQQLLANAQLQQETTHHHHRLPNLPLPLAFEFLFLILSALKFAWAVALIFLAVFLTMPSGLELLEASSLSVVVVLVS